MSASLGIWLGEGAGEPQIVVVLRREAGDSAPSRLSVGVGPNLPAALAELGLPGEGGFDGPVGVALSAESAAIRPLTVPAHSADRPAEVVGFLLEERSARPLEEVAVAWRPRAGPARLSSLALSGAGLAGAGLSGAGLSVLAAALDRRELARWAAELGTLGLRPDVVGLDAELVGESALLGGLDRDKLGSSGLLIWPTETATVIECWETNPTGRGTRTLRALRVLRYRLEPRTRSRFLSDLAAMWAAETAELDPDADPAAAADPVGVVLGDEATASLLGSGWSAVEPSLPSVPSEPTLRRGLLAAQAAAEAAADPGRATRLDWADQLPRDSAETTASSRDSASRVGSRGLGRALAAASALLTALLLIWAEQSRQAADRWEQHTLEARRFQENQWRSLFPSQKVPADVPLRMASELRRLRGLTGLTEATGRAVPSAKSGAAGPSVGSSAKSTLAASSGGPPEYRCALEELAKVAAALPAGEGLTVESVAVGPEGFEMTGRLARFAEAEDLARRLAGSTGRQVGPPSTSRLTDGRVYFSLRGSSAEPERGTP